MNYKLIGNNDYMFDLLGTIGKNRDVNDINGLLNANIKNTFSYKLLENIDVAVKCLDRHIKNNSKIHIITDSDCDGYSSAAIMYNYLSLIYEKKDNISWHVHEGKQHGIVLEELKNYNYDLLIVPDGGSNNFKQQKLLYEQGKEIIILDHHEVNKIQDTPAIIINNKMCDYPNKELSGVAIVYKFCQALDEFYYELNCADKFLDLVSLGLVSDMMDSRELETRYYMIKGLTKIRNKFFQALLNKQSFKLTRLNMIGIAFYISPLINAVCRIGTLEEKQNMFKAFIDTETQVDYKKRGTDKVEKVFLYEDMARQCVNIKSRQDKLKEKMVEQITERINSKQLNQNKIMFINGSEYNVGDFSGLVANDLASKYQKPVILLKQKEEQEGNNDSYYTGSARAYEKHPVKNLRSFIQGSNLFNFAEGHEGACGVGIVEDNIGAAIEYFNEQLIDIKDEQLFHIDFSIEGKNVSQSLIKDLDKLLDIYGTNFKEPYLLIKNININTEDVYINDKKSILSFTFKGIKYCIFFPEEVDCEKFKQGETISVNVIGRASINLFNNQETPQITISEYEIAEKENNEKSESGKKVKEFVW